MWIIVAFFSILCTELIGHIVHRFLHAGLIGWLSDLHMEHHNLYPPGGTQATDQYLYANRNTWIEKIGLEWIIPITTITIPLAALLLLFGLPWQYAVAGTMISFGWTWVTFSYMHGAFHLKKFWMTNNYIFSGWFKETRKLHLIHHNNMTVNFGITFFWFDKIYETFTRKFKK